MPKLGSLDRYRAPASAESRALAAAELADALTARKWETCHAIAADSPVSMGDVPW